MFGTDIQDFYFKMTMQKYDEILLEQTNGNKKNIANAQEFCEFCDLST